MVLGWVNLYADKICSVSYDRSIVEADKNGDLLLDFAPQAPAMADICRIKECVLEA